ncbi:hypothetical protein F4776DRAFT_665498 [Hypoxylon sp. NC0597]|nr:hypothetical protein F4776DRAFT_665498 [Hypoxylon sp. NC0597]
MSDMSLLGSTTLPDDSPKGGQPLGSAGVFFYDRTSLYAYAEIVRAQPARVDKSLWSFNTANDTRRLIQVQGGDNSFGVDTGGISASDPNSGMSFYTGGWTMGFNGTNNGIVKF